MEQSSLKIGNYSTSADVYKNGIYFLNDLRTEHVFFCLTINSAKAKMISREFTPRRDWQKIHGENFGNISYFLQPDQT